MQAVKRKRRRGYTRLSSKRQVTLPMRVVQELGLRPGDELRVETSGGLIVLSREPNLHQRRLMAMDEVSGSMPGVWQPGDLERLRSEWR